MLDLGGDLQSGNAAEMIACLQELAHQDKRSRLDDALRRCFADWREQSLPRVLLELGDRAMDGRLGDANLPRRQREVLRFAHGDERSKLRGGGGQLEATVASGHGAIEQVKRALHPIEQRSTDGGRKDPLRHTLHQISAGIPLELGDRLGDGRLGKIEEFHRARDSDAASMAALKVRR